MQPKRLFAGEPAVSLGSVNGDMVIKLPREPGQRLAA